LLKQPLLGVHNGVLFSDGDHCGACEYSAKSKNKEGLGKRSVGAYSNGSCSLAFWRSLLIEWRPDGRRLRQSAGDTPSEALEAQKRKRLELEANESGFILSDPLPTEEGFPLRRAIDRFLRDIKTFRKPLTHRKFETVLELFCEHVAPKSDAKQITADDIKNFIAWKKKRNQRDSTR
jgi:hypothetical protein